MWLMSWEATMGMGGPCTWLPPGCYLGICNDTSVESASGAVFIKAPPQVPHLPREGNLVLERVP